MEIMFVLGVLILVIAVIGMVIKSVSEPSMGKFIQMGELRGRTLEQVIAGVGLPNSYSRPAEGKLLVQWLRPGMHVALMFQFTGSSDSGNSDNHQTEYICLGVTHQYSG